MTAAAPRDVQRLGKTLGRLASDHDGERSAAALLADRQLRALGLGWQELVERAFRVSAPAVAPASRPPAGHHAATSWLLSCWPFLGEWERGFVASLHAQTWPPTPRQRTKLDEITKRVEARCGGVAS